MLQGSAQWKIINGLVTTKLLLLLTPCLCLCGLFNDTVRSLNCIESNGRVISGL